MENYLQELNEQQLAAVRYDGGPSLVIAGAGSGKTRVLTNKIAYLIAEGYDPRRILALTFTNKAAKEMRERIGLLIGEVEASKLWMGTFHSIFLRILQYNAERIGYRPRFTIYDTADTKSALKAIIKDMGLDEKTYPVVMVASIISRLKNSLISAEDYANDREQRTRDTRAGRPKLADIYSIYSDTCRRANAMDFDDILFYTNVLFRDNEDVLSKYQDFFLYILVDEYQDTNFSQHLIISKLCDRRRKLCVVGDDAQSIYSFRGANIHNILNLSSVYPDLHIFKLEQNYRSTQNILNVANSLIEKNKEQIPKHIFSTNAKGDKIQVLETYTDFEESYLVANKIAQLKMLQTGSYDDFAILYRTNAQSRLLEESLRKRNIPYRIYGGLSFYQRKEIKDALAYFRLSVNPNDDESLRRIINYPARGIGERTVFKIHQTAMDRHISMWDVLCDPAGTELDVNSGTLKKLVDFRELIATYIAQNESGTTAYDLGETVFKTSGILSSLYSDNTPENISRQENLNELLSAVRQFSESRMSQGDERTTMSDFLSEVSLATDQDEEEQQNVPRVTMMTVHAAKGLEFRNVIIVGVEDELFPSARAESPMEIEEERRLLYVAITRAKENCIMTYARQRYRNGMTHPTNQSRFLKDIDSSLLKLPAQMSSYAEMPYRKSSFDKPQWQNKRIEPILNTQKLKPVTSQSISQNVGNAALNATDLKEGMRIKHSVFGIGTIMKIETNPNLKINVNFDNVGMKTLLVKFAKFTIV